MGLATWFRRARVTPAVERSALVALESLEARQLLAAFVAHINFQPAASAVPAGYVADTGLAYAARNGLTYGWNAANNHTFARNSALSPDARYDTFDQMQKGGTYTWSIAVPNAAYQVHLVAGDATTTTANYQINVNGQLALGGVPTVANHWVTGDLTVTVTNGKLTISSAAGASNNVIDFIDITQVMPPTPPPATNNALVGVNLDGNADWGTAHIWADAAKTFRQWGTVGAPFVPNPLLTFTADDYPLQDADTLSYLNGYPNGVYKLTWTGAGSITAYGMGAISNVVHTGSNWTADVTITHDNPDGTGGIMELGIRGDVAANPVKNVHLWAPGYGPGQTFTTDFLHRVQPFGVLRFMDWTMTNNSSAIKWADRSQPTAMIQTFKGVDWEDVIELANESNRNVWINVPAQANDDYVKQLATLMLAKLNPALTVHVEYSNEVWNSDFQQGGYVVAQARKNKLITATDDFSRGAQQYAFRSKQIGDIFRTVFGTQSSRIIGVLGGQTSNTWWAQQGLAFINALYGAPSQFFKEVSIAPYVGIDLPAAPVGGWDVPSLFQELENFTNATLGPWILNHYTLAHNYNLALTAYEGGQSLTSAAIPDALKTAANNDPRMGQLYHDINNVWRNNGGTLFEQFSHIGGGWGLLDDARLPGSYKWDAVMSSIFATGDVTLDGRVDYADFLILKSNYHQPNRWWWEQGDFNNNGVGRDDLDAMYANLTGLSAAEWADVNAFRAANP